MTIEKLLEARRKTHGVFEYYSEVAQELKATVRIHSDKCNEQQREALENICQKMARILTGDPNEPDHWADIQGYAKRGEESIKKVDETQLA
jgi:molecular chaperone DnaK (HSP70)